ncbi:hypothetical protein [Prolixibacter sp. SD074]|uniref:hypothetical protein n=1 Tax=Prolixibacter sp. SD074 TaxID=2652391 RepID=UPI0012990AB4|nr:hypothetical protein [Prolixibacter sp. SD074]
MKNHSSIAFLLFPVSSADITGQIEGGHSKNSSSVEKVVFSVIQLSDLPMAVKESVAEELTGCRLSNQVITGTISGKPVYRLTFRSPSGINNVLYKADGERYVAQLQN